MRGTSDLPLAKLLAAFGVELTDQRASARPTFNATLTFDGMDCKLSTVHDGGAAQKAGLSSGDTLVALDGLRICVKGGKSNLETLLASYKVGDKAVVVAFRRDELMEFKITLQADVTPAVQLAASSGKRTARLPRPSIG